MVSSSILPPRPRVTVPCKIRLRLVAQGAAYAQKSESARELLSKAASRRR